MFPRTLSEKQFMDLFCFEDQQMSSVGRCKVSCGKNYLIETRSGFNIFHRYTNTTWYLHNYCFAKSVFPMSREDLNCHFVLLLTIFGLAFPQYNMKPGKPSGKCTPSTVTSSNYAFCHTVYCIYYLCIVVSNKHRLCPWIKWTDFWQTDTAVFSKK
jgi:hypothetical protein